MGTFFKSKAWKMNITNRLIQKEIMDIGNGNIAITNTSVLNPTMENHSRILFGNEATDRLQQIEKTNKIATVATIICTLCFVIIGTALSVYIIRKGNQALELARAGKPSIFGTPPSELAHGYDGTHGDAGGGYFTYDDRNKTQKFIDRASNIAAISGISSIIATLIGVVSGGIFIPLAIMAKNAPLQKEADELIEKRYTCLTDDIINALDNGHTDILKDLEIPKNRERLTQRFGLLGRIKIIQKICLAGEAMEQMHKCQTDLSDQLTQLEERNIQSLTTLSEYEHTLDDLKGRLPTDIKEFEPHLAKMTQLIQNIKIEKLKNKILNQKPEHKKLQIDLIKYQIKALSTDHEKTALLLEIAEKRVAKSSCELLLLEKEIKGIDTQSIQTEIDKLQTQIETLEIQIQRANRQW